jgi:O-antigen ligase
MVVSPIFFVCILAALLNGYAIDIAGFTITPERMIIAPLLLLTILIIVARNSLVRPSATSVLIFIWIMWALLACILSDEKSWVLRQWLNLVAAVSFYFIVVQLKIDFVGEISKDSLDLLGWIYGPFMACAYFITLFDASIVFEYISFVVQTPDGLRLRATFLEPNFYGALMVPLILLYISTYRNTINWWIVFIGLNTALLFTFSRGPWIAYLVSISLYYILTSRKKLSVRKILFYVITSLILLTVVTITIYYLSSIFGDDSVIHRIHSIKNRLLLYEIALENIAANPLLGNGIYSFSVISSEDILTAGINEEGWIANIFLLVIHDTGVIGFLIFSAIFIVIIYKGVVITRINLFISKKQNKLGAALIAGGISLFISGMTIPAITHAAFWIFWGFTDIYFARANKLRGSSNV